MHTLPPACLPVCCQATLPRLLHLTACLPAVLPGCFCPGYSAQANAHPATCLPACLLARLLCPGYCTPCHLPACLFAGQAVLPRLLCPGYCTPCHLPASCLLLPRLLCPGYCTPCLPACLPLLARLLCPGYCTPCHLPACLFAGQATLPRLLHTLPPACLPVLPRLNTLPGYSAQATATAHPATCLPSCLLAARLLCPGY